MVWILKPLASSASDIQVVWKPGLETKDMQLCPMSVPQDGWFVVPSGKLTVRPW